MPTREELRVQFMLALAANASCINYLSLEDPYPEMYGDLAEWIHNQAEALVGFALPD
jgi:hypothetical protein